MPSLGPRARRRAALLAAVTVLVVGGGVAYDVTHGGSHASKQQQYGDLPLGEDNLGVAYGARPAQVLRRLGRPSEKRGACWIYDAPDGKVNGVATLQGAGVDAMKFCFAEDAVGAQAVAHIEWHFKTSTYHKVRDPAHWGQPEYIGCNTAHPCVANS
jgi:hypothetical protein